MSLLPWPGAIVKILHCDGRVDTSGWKRRLRRKLWWSGATFLPWTRVVLDNHLFWYFLFEASRSSPLPLWAKHNLLFLTLLSLLSSPMVINRPGLAGAVLQNTPSLIKTLTNSSVVKVSSKHPHSQTVRARDLKLWENVHLPPYVMCHVSYVRCHRSHINF